MTELIIRYNGDIAAVTESLNGKVDILSPSFAIALIDEATIPMLYSYPEVEYIEKPKRLLYQLTSAARAACIPTRESDLTGKGVVIGIVDSGIDYTLPEFKGRLDTIFESGGTVFTREEIEGGNIPHTDDNGHGTVIAGITAALAPQATLVVAKVGYNEDFAQTTDIMRAFSLITSRAKELNMPLVINLSYGTNDGAHDGTTLFEQYIDELAASYRMNIVVATGNEGDKAHHYSGTVTEGDYTDIEINIYGEVTELYISIHISFADNIAISLVTPSGTLLYPDVRGIGYNTTSIALADIQPSPYTIDSSIQLRLSGQPVQSGLWTIRLYGKSVLDGRVNAWLPVSEGIGKSVSFLKPTADITLTIPSAAYRVISVGGYNSDNNTLAPFSGRGYTAVTQYIKPDLVAPAVGIYTLGKGGTKDSYSGTSIAAPFVTAATALLMQWGIADKHDPTLYGERLKAYLRLGAVRTEDNTYPNRAWGYGRLCMTGALSLLNRVTISQENSSADYYPITTEYTPQIEERLKELAIPYHRLHYSNELIIYLPYRPNGIESILSERTGLPLVLAPMDTDLNYAVGADKLQAPPTELSGRGVVVGIVDTGINLDSPELVYPNGDSRINSLWDMTVDGKPPEGYSFGTEYTAEELNSGSVNSSDPYNHGTALAEVAAGINGIAPDSTIIAVKLRQASKALRTRNLVPSEAEAYSSADLLLGIEYVLDTAGRLNSPVSIIIGMGSNEGGHNSQTRLERYLAQLSQRSGVCISVASGNEAAAAHHCRFELTSQGYYDMELKIGENESGFPICIWNNLSSRISVAIISPIGEQIERIPAINSFTASYRLTLSRTDIELSYYIPAPATSDQLTFIKLINPLAGVWSIRVYGDSLSGPIHAWLPVTEFIGRDTVFLSPDSFTTATTPSTADNVLCVGAYKPSDGTIYPYSGRGPSRSGRVLPDIIAPSGGSTSVAAAIAGGCAALLLEWGFVKGNNKTLNTVSVSAYLKSSATRDDNIYPNNVTGYGRLNIYNAFAKLL